MTFTLLLAIAIVILGLVGMFNYTRIMTEMDMQFVRFGRAAGPMKLVLLGLCGFLFFGALYSLAMYYNPKMTSQLQQDAVALADRAGDFVSKVEGMVGSEVDPGVDGRQKSILASQKSALQVVDNGKQGNGPMANIPDNILTKFWLPQYTFRDPDGCSRTFKSAGNCHGVSRHFRDESRTVASGCNKLHVTAPQQIPWVQNAQITY